MFAQSSPPRPQLPSERATTPENGTERPHGERVLMTITLGGVGGAGTYVASLLPALAAEYDVTLATHGEGPVVAAARAAGIEHVPLRHVRWPINPLRDLLGLVEFVRVCRRLRPMVVHANTSKAGLLGLAAARVTGVPVRIFTAHGWPFHSYSGAARLHRWVHRLINRLATVIVCVSESELHFGNEAGVCSPEKTVVIYNGVDVDAAVHADPGREPACVVSVGRLKEPKQFTTFVRAIAKLEKRDVNALIVGEGPDRGEIEREIDRLGVRDRVVLTGERDDVPRLLADAGVFVLSTRAEGLPLSVLEAMAAGLPVVASDIGASRELVVDGETGFLFPRGNVDALATALERLLRDPGLRERLGAAGRTRVKQLFELGPFVEAHLQLYRRALAATTHEAAENESDETRLATEAVSREPRRSSP